MKLHFSKYHGTGNDFIMINSRKNVMPDRSKPMIEWLCDRHFGIGADGLIILEPSVEHDFRMSYYNSDGLPGTMCGNGGRCATVFAMREGWTGSDCRFEAADGIHHASVLDNDVARLELLDVAGVDTLPEGFWLNTGSPHLVTFRDDVDSMDVETEGRNLRNDPRFSDGTNVNFVQAEEGGILVRTYERGVEAETLSCGTGVTASAIAASLHFPGFRSPVRVRTRGGELSVEFRSDGNNFTEIFLNGPVTEVFSGTITI